MPTEPPRRPPTPRAPAALIIIAAIVSVAALYLGREFFIPVALALCFNALLRPVVHGLERLRIPTALGAAIVVLGGLGVVVVGGWALSGPVSVWVDKPREPQDSAREAPRHRPPTRPLDRRGGR